MQLVAYGAQDIYLTGNPMITYFKSVYRRHTNFAMESIEQVFSGSTSFGKKSTALISRNADLLSGLYLEVTLPHVISNNGQVRWTDSVGHYLIDYVEISIGGQVMDRHYADWLEIWAQLSVPASQSASYFEMIGLDGKIGLQSRAVAGTRQGPGGNTNANGNRILYVPLQFWFCRNVGLALPLIALQYHEVEINLKLNTLNNLIFDTSDIGAGNAVGTETVGADTGESLNVKLWADYIYLDTDERRRFAQVSHEYLIEQVQFLEDKTYNSTSASVDLIFNHPVKELVWVCRQTVAETAKQWVNFTNNLADFETDDLAYMGRPSGHLDADAAQDGIQIGDTTATQAAYRRRVSSNMVQTAQITLNGNDRTAVHEGLYFNKYQPGKYHTSTPASPGINVYSFALKPEDHQPSGTCNFSRIDNAQLKLTLSAHTANHKGVATAPSGVIKVFAVNYNVLRIMSGMGGLAYSN